MVSSYSTFMTFFRTQAKEHPSPVSLPTGMTSSVLLCDKVIPVVTGKTPYQNEPHSNGIQEKKKKKKKKN